MNKRVFIAFLCLLFQCSLVFADSYDFSSTKCIPIKMTIRNELSTKNPIPEGSEIKFRIIEDVKYNGKFIVKRGEIVQARVGTIITSGMNGFPAEIIIDDFRISNIDESKLISEFTKKGQNRCLWVYPLKWALTPIPFVGSLTNLIKGGNAYLKPSDIVTVYYYPEW